jgi:hypothetical protein
MGLGNAAKRVLGERVGPEKGYWGGGGEGCRGGKGIKNCFYSAAIKIFLCSCREREKTDDHGWGGGDNTFISPGFSSPHPPPRLGVE